MSDQLITNEPVDLEEGWVLCNTEMLMQLMRQGWVAQLPEVVFGDDELAVLLDDSNEQFYGGVDDTLRDIISIESVGEMDVQCIEVADDQHLYVTDGYICSHNTSSIVFLKSSDDQMMETLTKMSGKTHQTRIETKQIKENTQRIWQRIDPEVTVTVKAEEEDVIQYNDLAFISERNSIIFYAGKSPIWNRNETILPMSWFLLNDQIKHPGHEYSLKTMPTLSSAAEFDVRKNQPNFRAMLDKRMKQAVRVEKAREIYMQTYGYDEYQMSQLDPDILSDELMDIVDAMVAEDEAKSAKARAEGEEDTSDTAKIAKSAATATENEEMTAEMARRKKRMEDDGLKRYAGGHYSREDLRSGHTMDADLLQVYLTCRGDMARDTEYFRVVGASLFSADSKTPYIVKKDDSEFLKQMNDKAKDPDSRVYSEEDIDTGKNIGSFVVTDEFYEFLASFDGAWPFAKGRFDRMLGQKASY